MDESAAQIFAAQMAVLFEVIQWIAHSTNTDTRELINNLHDLRAASMRTNTTASPAPICHLLHLLETTQNIIRSIQPTDAPASVERALTGTNSARDGAGMASAI